MAISRFNPAGYVYVITGKRPVDSDGRPADGTYFTKVGCSANSFSSKNGRCDAPNFWLRALGFGEVIVHADEAHSQAWHVERALKKALDEWRHPREICGKSKETFNVPPEQAIVELRGLLLKKYNA